LAQQNVERFPPDLAMTLNNLASLAKSTMRLEEARQHYEEALRIYREMAQRAPDQYLPKVAEMLNSLGFVTEPRDEWMSPDRTMKKR